MKVPPEIERKILESARTVTGVKAPDIAPSVPQVSSASTKKKSKYRNKKTTIGELTFDSKKEARRWLVLIEMQRRGEISFLRRQVPFRLVVNGVKIATYRADFVYVQNGQRIVEDAKGMLTDVYKIKRRLMQAIHGIEIKET